jgi:O-acetyl-ADP-ribose deacetylase
MRLQLLQGDITKQTADAIVNAANERMLGGGGVDGAIHRAAGPELKAACERVPEVRPGVRCPTGEARITPGFGLAAKHVIHTVGPSMLEPGMSAERGQPLLQAAYASSLALAEKHRLAIIAFPAISCGAFGFRHNRSAAAALAAIGSHRANRTASALAEIRFVLFGEGAYDIWVETCALLT